MKFNFFSDNTKDKIDKKFTNIQTKGFHFANKAHKYGVNVCLMFIAYQMYAFLRDYNDFFLHARQVNELDDKIDPDGPLNKKTAD